MFIDSGVSPVTSTTRVCPTGAQVVPAWWSGFISQLVTEVHFNILRACSRISGNSSSLPPLDCLRFLRLVGAVQRPLRR